jgi:hypothetical protein
MSSFTDKLIVSPINGTGRWQLEAEFDYHVGTEESEIVIHVPSGFQTDFASIPQCFWSILPPWGRWGKPAVIHDYLYSKQGALFANQRYGRTIIYDRKDCDEIFLEAMTVLGVNWLTRRIMYGAVRSFGWAAWNKYYKKAI